MTRAFVDWTLRYGKWIWIVALALAIPATWRTANLYLNLRSELEELLPSDAPSVRAIGELRARTPGLQYLGVVVDVGDRARLAEGERFIDNLAARIRSYPPHLVRSVRIGMAEERTFLETHGALYVDLADLQTIRARIEARRDYEVARETGSALRDNVPPPPLDFSDIERKYEAKLPTRGDATTDRYSSEAQHATMLLVEVGGFESGTSHGKELLSRVQSDVAALRGDGLVPGMRIGYAGDVAISVEELDALVADLAFSTVLVVCVISALIIYIYRWSLSVVVLVPTLVLAAVYAFALASLPPLRVTELNSNTAFLGAIIIGNGINFGIILLSRYVEERRHGHDVPDAMVTAVRSARLGTLSAAIAAGVAYTSLVSTQFRGFRQFGYIGGLGMIASWAIAFVCMPPLIAWLDRDGRAITRYRETYVAAHIARLVKRAPITVLVIGVVLTTLSVAKVRTFGVHELEHDVSKLRRADTWTEGEGYWGRRMDALLGHYLTPTVLLASSPEQARAIASRLREDAARPPLDEMIADIRTLDDVLPKLQDEKIAEARAIRADMTPRMWSLVPPEKREAIERLLGNDDPKPVTLADLPRVFATGLVERDGRAGRAVLVFPRPSKALWEGPPLVAFVRALREAATVGGPEPAPVAGALPLSADILASVQRDGPRASALAFAFVIAVVVVMFRRRAATFYVIASLTIGVVWLAAAMMALDVKINFANFIAFPITFGVGADYAMNVMSRYVQDDERDIARTVRATGSAVALCSFTTIIGYSSLLVAENRALFSFGVAAVLGEITCLASALAFLPAVLVLVERRSRAPTGRPPSTSTWAGGARPTSANSPSIASGSGSTRPAPKQRT